jgi:hypothetical protein
MWTTSAGSPVGKVAGVGVARARGRLGLGAGAATAAVAGMAALRGSSPDLFLGAGGVVSMRVEGAEEGGELTGWRSFRGCCQPC